MLSAPVNIPDNGILTLEFSVTGLTDANLASLTQGICGVQIDFMHEYLGDLTVTLVSPAGTMVELIGAPTTAISPTNLSRWDIDFVPCGTPPNPDPGFAPMWDNLQAWQALTPYSGSYHPHSGCLEDFNVGPANGIWQFIIQDHDPFQLGSITSLTLIFCNPTGLVCSECIANAGTLSPTSFSICSGENIQSSDLTLDFGGNTPPASMYSYLYLLTSGNTILQSGTNFSITPPVGNYSICGLSYLTSDAAIIDALIASNDYTTLTQAVDNGVACADYTQTCVSVEVKSKPDTMIVSGDLCNGEIFSFGGQQYATTGIFYQVHDGPGLCDTIYEIRLSPRSLNVMLTMPDTLSCGGGDVQVGSTVTGAMGPFDYQWSTVSGHIVSPDDGATVFVDQAGQYFLEVTDGICSGNSSANVLADQDFPQVFFDGGTLSCDQPSLNINPIYIPTDGVVMWTGPGGFMSSQPNITVTVPGMYVMKVTNASGCSTSRAVDIGIDTMTTPFSIYILNKDCINGTATLANTFPDQMKGWNWTGPNGFTTDYWRPLVTMPGTYNLTATFLNGCTRSASFFFDGDFLVPDIMLSPPDTLNCNETLTITVSSATNGALFTWNGPNGFYSTNASIQVTQQGQYDATILAPNGCQNGGSVPVALGNDIFNFQVITDTITCAQPVVTIGVIAPEADVYQWMGYSGPDADQPFIQVSAGGLYHVLMEDVQSGCQVIAEVLVPTDVSIPVFGYTTDTISCNQPLATLTFVPVSGINYSSVHWLLPDQTTVSGPIAVSDQPGQHLLFATSENGCEGIRSFSIPYDTLVPFLILEADTLLCRDTAGIISQTLDSIVGYQWSGPGILSDNGAYIDVTAPGWYHLEAYGLNGCPAKHDILVDSNFVLPDYLLAADSLRCDRPAVLTVDPLHPVSGIVWFDPSGGLISTDSFAVVNQPGTYITYITGTNRCEAIDSAVIDPLVFPDILLTSDTFTCTALQVDVSVTVDIPVYTLAWEDMNGDTFSLSPVIQVTQPGPFVASVSGQNACETRDTIRVPYDTIHPVADIQVMGAIRCKNRDATLDGSASSPLPLSYAWTTSGGNILSDPSQVTVDVRDTGTYVLTVVMIRNGCSDTSSYQLLEDPDAITGLILDLTPPKCEGDHNASIQILSVMGGIPPFQYQIDGGALQSGTLFDQLGAGMYVLTAVDSGNCAYDSVVVIEPAIAFSVDAGPDQEIYLGEQANLEGMSNLDPMMVQNDLWSNLGTPICSQCPSFQVSPMETTSYTYALTSATGCTVADETTVFVLEHGKYFIPNVFSPNGDGINDEVRLTASPGIERVNKWIIFDRWGNAVFGRTEFDPDDTSVFWNGQTTTGEFSNPGVFPYLLEIQLINGKIEVYNGDITLIR